MCPMRKPFLTLSTLILLLAGACARTHPWERETLARPSMQVDGDGDRDALRRHLLGVREGAVGGLGGGGGGCGCN
jgi:hypothetical protein